MTKFSLCVYKYFHVCVCRHAGIQVYVHMYMFSYKLHIRLFYDTAFSMNLKVIYSAKLTSHVVSHKDIIFSISIQLPLQAWTSSLESNRRMLGLKHKSSCLSDWHAANKAICSSHWVILLKLKLTKCGIPWTLGVARNDWTSVLMNSIQNAGISSGI